MLVTAERGFDHEQNLALYEIGVVILVAQSNRLADYEPLAPSLLAEIAKIRNEELRKVPADPGGSRA